MEYIQLAIFWILYFAAHSLLATNFIKSMVRRIFPKLFRYYRMAYSMIAILSLIPLLIYLKSLSTPYLFRSSIYILLLGSIILTVGAVVGYLSLKSYKSSDFLGFQQLRGNEIGTTQLNLEGLNRYVRHPLYFATLLFIWGVWLLWPTKSLLLTNAIICIYLVIGTKLEEGKLIEQFGDEYKTYQQKVSMLLPMKKGKYFR